MPTGYTDKLYRDESQTFTEFALRCARGMGACIMQRDDPCDIPPRKQKASDYNQRRLVEARNELERLSEMTPQQANEEASAERETKLKERERHNREALELLARYQQMMIAVEHWDPPSTDHVGMKEFMIEQLQTSINFDCSTGDWPKIPPVMSGEEWRQAQIQKVLHDIDYHTRENLKEIKRTESRNRWIQQLYDSLSLDYTEGP